MFPSIAVFEFRYQLKNPVFWVAAGMFFLLAFGSVASSNVQIGSTSNVHKNAAFVIVQTCLIFSILYMFVTTAFVSNVVVRDDETGFGPIIRSTRVGKADYLFGRFSGAFLAACLSFVAVPLGLWLGTLMPWVDKETLGPFVPGHYLFAYFWVAVPVLFLSSAIFFALATVTRSMMWTYVGLVAFLVLRSIFGLLLSRPGLETIAALWEPYGTSAYGLATRYWTAAERNSLVPAIAGWMLWNRLLWFGVALGFLGLAYSLFRFETARPARKQRKRAKLAQAAAAESDGAPALTTTSSARPQFGPATAWAQLWARTRLDMGQVFKSPAYFVLLALGALLSSVNLWLTSHDGIYGGQVYPVTRLMIGALGGTFTFISLIVAVYYAGELVWRERERGTGDMIDATAVPDWAFIAPKTLAIALVLISTLAAAVLMAMLVQTLSGYTAYEVGHYLTWFLLPQSIDMTLLAVLAIFVQALSPHKFVGWGVMVIYLISTIVLSSFGLEHNLYQYGGAPDTGLSDMNGQSQFWAGPYWFRLYWSAFATVLLVIAYGLWPRGSQPRYAARLRRLPGRLRGGAGLLLAAALAVFVGTGAWIYTNTNVWNPYRNHLDQERWFADYEKQLLRYETLPQPKITDVVLNVALYPDRPEAVTSGLYVIENRTGAAIPELHIRFDRDLHVDALSVEGARPRRTLERFNYRIFAFDAPLQPGERRRVSFTTRRGQHGFRNSGQETRVIANGTFLNNMEITPLIGMDRSMLMTDRAKRRKYGLPPDLRPAKLEDEGARRFGLFRHDSDFVNADITVSTRADQTAIAPGYQLSDHVQDGRRTARFKTEAPINHFFSIQSARYAVKRETYKGVDLAVYYHPGHDWNVGRMISALKVGLDYDQANFSPYQFRQVRIQEFPDYAKFAQSFANTIPWSEGLGFIFKLTDPSKIDMVTYITAHELGHQWWGHQLVSSDQQGASMPIETLAQYSALMAMERMYGRDQIRKFLKYELDSYLKARGSEALEELPLERVENQPYIHYRKGSLVMYRLQAEIGEAAVNRALHKVLATYAFKGAPYPRSKEVVDAFRAEAPADKQALITDLFEKITLYDLKAKGATAKKRPDGKWEVALQVDAAKLYADGKGKETKAPMNETLDVGLFAREPGKKGFVSADVIALQRLPIRSGLQTVTLVADRLPAFAGVDPYTMAIDRNADDNLVKVTK